MIQRVMICKLHDGTDLDTMCEYDKYCHVIEDNQRLN